jgi:hypothetical protein
MRRYRFHLRLLVLMGIALVATVPYFLTRPLRRALLAR